MSSALAIVLVPAIDPPSLRWRPLPILALALCLMFPTAAMAAAGRSDTSYDVSSTGAARYSIPLSLPGGTAGLQPQLAITYDSSAGDGLLGQGFSIAGLSVIRHCPRTIVQDGVAAPISYGTGARYCLDGQRLRLASGTHGQAGAVYRTEIESFSRITLYGSAGASPAYFTVERKDGLIYEYGKTADSRIEIAGSTTVRLWALSRILDRAGNYVDFTYTKDPANGTYRPNEIRYTGNGSQGLNPPYTVRFNYQTTQRPDPSYGYFPAGTGTGQVNLVTRVDKIELLHQLDVVRYWQVAWGSTGGAAGRSRIASVQECAATPTDCLPPTSFTWQSGTPGYGSEGTYSGLTNLQLMDLTGDGRTDLVYVASGSWRYRPGNVSGGFGAEVNTGISASGQLPVEVIEWDGDGRDDLLVTQSGTYRVLRSTGTGFATPINTGIAVGDQAAFDINGDGRHDLVRVSTASGMVQIHVRLRTTSGFAPTETLAYSGYADTGMNIGSASWSVSTVQRRQRSHDRRWDFNGDGREGFLLYLSVEDPEQVMPPYPLWAVFTPTNTGGTPQVNVMGTVGGPGYISQLDPVPMDVNGDGLKDLVYATGNSYRIRFSRGVYFTAQVTGPAITGHVTTASVVTDYDGDGVADFVVRSTATNTWHVLRGTGTGLAAPINTGLSAANATAPRVGDYNGDGMPDLLWSNFSTGAWHFRPRSGLYPDLLSQANDGYGNAVSFQYDSIARNNYTRHTDAIYPEQDVSGPMQVVATLTASDGVGGTFSQNYWYYGARRHLEGRGFQGFDRVRRQDSRNSLYAWAYFERSFPFTGGVIRNELYQPNGTTLISRDMHTWASHSYGSGNEIRRLPYISQTVATRYEVGGVLNAALVSTATSVHVVDAATGTVTDTTTTVTEAATANGVQAGASYVMRSWTSALYTSTTDWCIGRPQTLQSIHSHNQYGGSQLTRQQNVTWDGPFCRPTQVAEAQGDGQWQMTTAWGYDAFGNISSETVTGIGMSPRTTSMHWGTTGQFPGSVTNALAQTTQLGWNHAKGLQTSQTDPNGLTISWDHDAFGRMILEARPDNTSTTLSYGDCAGIGCVNSNNRLVVTETEYAAGGGTIRDTFHYLDRFDRPLVTRAQLLSGAYNRVERQYDALGRLDRESAPCWWGACSLYWTTHSYDLLDRLTQSSQPLSASDPTPQVTTTFHEGLTTRIVDPLGKQTSQIGNVLGSLARTRDHDSHHKSFDFNGFGELLRVTDSLGNTLQANSYNVRGMLISQTDMDRGAWTFQPNALGEITHVRDAKTSAPSWTTVMGYDALGRMTSRQDVPEGITSTWTWGTSAAAKNIGRLAALAGPGYSESYAYDSLGRPQETTINADAQYKIEYGYNSLGALATLTYPVSTLGYRLKLQYDYQHGQLLRIKDFNAPSTVFWQANATDPRGRAIDEQLGASLQRIRGFDPVSGRLEYIQTGPGGNAAVQNLVYQWDGVGNLAWRRDDNQNLTEAFSYDHLHRLTSSTLNGAGNLSVAYSALGNITSKTGVGSYSYHATKKHAVVSTSSGGSYAYDANGNMTSRNGSTIVWNSFNLPSVIHGSGSNQSQFFYTPDRARYKQVANYAGTTETTIYVGGMLEKLTRGALTEFKHLIQAGQEHTVLYTRRSNGTTDTFHVTRDHLGSAAAITDASGNVLVQESFTAFGERRGANWAGSPSSGDWTQFANTTRRGFTAHEHLDNLNLIHMNGRVYDPGLGRFISADPFIDGSTNTQGYNRYSYVKNNPLRAFDPTGFKGKNTDERNESEGPGGGHVNPDGKPIPEIVVTGKRPGGWTGVPGASMTIVSGDGGEHAAWLTAAADAAGTAFRYGVFDYEDPLMGSYWAEAALLMPVGKLFKFVYVLHAVHGMKVARGGAARGITHAHHAWPKYLGGPKVQDLQRLPKSVHDAYHSGLDKILPRQRGTAYYDNLGSAARQQMQRDLADYTKAFDAKNGTQLYDSMIRNGFPGP